VITDLDQTIKKLLVEELPIKTAKST